MAFDAANPSGWNVYARWVLTTSTGAVQSWQQSNLTWTREESLTAIAAAQFSELPPEKLASTGLETEGFAKRLRRHILDAKVFSSHVSEFLWLRSSKSRDSCNI
jgi:ER membrane protein complex subunit 1